MVLFPVIVERVISKIPVVSEWIAPPPFTEPSPVVRPPVSVSWVSAKSPLAAVMLKMRDCSPASMVTVPPLLVASIETASVIVSWAPPSVMVSPAREASNKTSSAPAVALAA